MWNSSDAELSAAFSQVNGLLLTGGHISRHSGYSNSTFKLLRMAQAANDAGDFFPVWGTCQGHEQLAQVGSGQQEPSILKPTAGTEGLIVPLNFTEHASSSRLLSAASAEVMSTLSKHKVTINLHSLGALAADMTRSGSAEAAFYRVLATNTNSAGSEFVSLMEGRAYPFYTSQFHGEKNAFEWNQGWELNNTAQGAEAHTAEAVAAMQYLSSFFVSEARKSPHVWLAEEEEEEKKPSKEGFRLPLIYNFQAIDAVGITSQGYEQVYVFK
jgi:gamma-glutamyl hydrolase